MTYDLTVDRLFDAPADVVFGAFVDPDAQRELYGDPDEPTWVVESELDLRVGGTWTIAFGRKGDDPYRETNVFTEVDPRRIVFDSSMHLPDEGHTVHTTVTVTLEDRNGGTLLTIHQTGFQRERDRDGIRDGWPSLLEALQRVVAGERAESDHTIRNTERSDR